jgi:polysaccharide transporter, PST family
MINKAITTITNLKNNKDHKRVLINFLSLSLIQVSNYLIPLITFPYLVRTLGIEMFGLVAFGQNIFSYFEQILGYSFSLTAPKEISQSSDDKIKTSQIFHKVLFTKLALLVLCLVFVLAITLLVPRLYEIKTMMWAGIVILLANVLQFDWFFQGIQEMKNITILNLSARFLSIVLLFATVHRSSDIVAALIFLPVCNILIGFIALFLIYRKFGLQFIPPQYKTVFEQLKDGFSIFTSQFLVRFYSSDINITLLGFLSNNLTLGIYTFANRIFALAAAATTPLSYALYPHLAKLYTENIEQYKKQFKTILITIFAVFIVLGCLLFIGADFITTLLAGQQTPQSSLILRILSIALVFAPFGSFYTQAFIIQGRDRYLLWTNLIYIVINISALLSSFYLFKEIGLAITSVVIHIAVFFVPLFFLKKWKMV